jgi:hypothetical protein
VVQPKGEDIAETGVVLYYQDVAKYVTPQLAYIVEVERYQAKVGGREDLTPIALRGTSIFDLKRVPGRLCIGTQTP